MEIERYIQVQLDHLEKKQDAALSEFGKARNIGGMQELRNFLTFARQVQQAQLQGARPMYKAGGIPASVEVLGTQLLARLGLPPDLPLANFRENKWRQQLINQLPMDKAHAVHLVHRLMENEELAGHLLALFQESSGKEKAPAPSPNTTPSTSPQVTPIAVLSNVAIAPPLPGCTVPDKETSTIQTLGNATVSRDAPSAVLQSSAVLDVPAHAREKSTQTPTPRRFTCPKCGRTFAWNYQLETHPQQCAPTLIDSICEALRLPGGVREAAQEIGRSPSFQKLRGASRGEFAAACIYCTCSKLGVPLSLAQVRAACGVDLKWRTVLSLRGGRPDLHPAATNQRSPVHQVRFVGDQLHLPEAVLQRAMEIAQRVEG